MQEDLLQEISQFFDWYKQTYGSVISIDGEIEIDQSKNPVSLANETKSELQQNLGSHTQADVFNENLVHQNHPQLKTFYHEINQCTKCSLHKQRTHFVFGMGNPTADLMFIGEAPGAEEDRTGRPFVGRAGELLTKIIESIKLSRDQVYNPES